MTRRTLADGIEWNDIRVATALLLALCLMLTPLAANAGAPASALAQSVSDRLVLAFYYTWFDENTWTYDQLSDLPAQTYASRDRSIMGRHIDQAKSAGIDAFLVAWYGPNSGNQTEGNLTALLEEAAARNFRIGVLFETDSPFFNGVGDVTAALQHLNAVHANHPAFLRVDGRPVVFFWRPSIYATDTWRAIRAQADPGYHNVWISEGVDTSYLQVFDGHHLYSNTWNPPANLEAVNQKFAGQVSQASQTHGQSKLWVATVMPGHNDTRIRSAGFVQDRAGGTAYAQSWQAAIASQPNWIVINSFNEWPEGTYIEPSVAYGDQYLALSATWSSAFKGAPGPAISAAAFMPAPPEPTPIPETSIPTAFVDVTLLNLRTGPGTDYDVVDMASQGTALLITGQLAGSPDWLRIEYAGADAWIFAPMVKTAGPMENIAVVNVLSDSTNGAAVGATLSYSKGPSGAPFRNTYSVPIMPYMVP